MTGKRSTHFQGQPTTKDYIDKIKKQMAHGETKSPAFTRFSNQTRDRKEVFYLQPSLFIQDAQEFLKNQQD